MNEFCKTVFGDYTGVQLLGFLWFFIIGYVIYGMTETNSRNIQSPNTPKKWSWKFWFYDNWKRYIATVSCTYVLFRFYSEFSGHSFGDVDAVTLGLVGDGIAAMLKKKIKSVVGADREKYLNQTEKENNEERG